MLQGAEVNITRNPKITFRFHEDGRDRELVINERWCIEQSINEAQATVDAMSDTINALTEKDEAAIFERTKVHPRKEDVRAFVVSRLVSEEAAKLGKEKFAEYLRQINVFFEEFHTNIHK